MNNLIVVDDSDEDKFEVIPATDTYAGLITASPTSTPAEIYVKKHTTAESMRVAKVKADHVGYLLGYSSGATIKWRDVSYYHAIELRAKLTTSKNNKGEPLSPSTMNHTLIAFRQMAKIAWMMGIIEHKQYNVLCTVEMMRGNRRKIRNLPMSHDVEALIDVCMQDPSPAGPRDAAIITLAFGAGLRRAEITNIMYPRDLLYRQSALNVIGKGNKQRLMPLEHYMFDVISTWVDDTRGDHPGPLFSRIRKNGDIEPQKLTPAAIRYILEQRCLQAGIPIIRPHDARSAYGTNLLSNGTDLVTVRNLLGHSSVSTTERYMQVDQDDMRDAVKNNLSILSSVKFKNS